MQMSGQMLAADVDLGRETHATKTPPTNPFGQ
jgi:hypothetical protein